VPTEGPLLRLSLLTLAERVHRFVWSFHHILLDGWSTQIVLRELFAIYGALTASRAPVLPPVRPYREFVADLSTIDAAQTAAFWQRKLAGFAAPTPLPTATGSPAPVGASAERHLAFEVGETAEIAAFGRQHGLTVSTLVHGVWALLLARCARVDDVVFGT